MAQRYRSTRAVVMEACAMLGCSARAGSAGREQAYPE